MSHRHKAATRSDAWQNSPAKSETHADNHRHRHNTILIHRQRFAALDSAKAERHRLTPCSQTAHQNRSEGRDNHTATQNARRARKTNVRHPHVLARKNMNARPHSGQRDSDNPERSYPQPLHRRSPMTQILLCLSPRANATTSVVALHRRFMPSMTPLRKCRPATRRSPDPASQSSRRSDDRPQCPEAHASTCARPRNQPC